jgi:hypothetical protein
MSVLNIGAEIPGKANQRIGTVMPRDKEGNQAMKATALMVQAATEGQRFPSIDEAFRLAGELPDGPPRGSRRQQGKGPAAQRPSR